MTQPTLVTGASGMVGNNVIRLLCKQGRPVRVLVRKTSDHRPIADLDVEVAYGDIRDRDAVEAAVEGTQAVIHAAAMVYIGWTRVDEQMAINVEGTRNIAIAAQKAHIPMVLVSSVDSLAIGRRDREIDEETPLTGREVPCGYVLSKRAAEQVVLQHVQQGATGMIVNPGFMLGPWDWKPTSGQMVLTIVTRWVPMAPLGGCNVCDVRDVAVGILAALEKGQSGRRYILGGHNVTYRHLWQMIARTTKSFPPFGWAGPMVRLLAGGGGDLWTKLTGREGELNSAMTTMSGQFHWCSSQRAHMELGYQVRPMQETINASWQWLVKYGYVNTDESEGVAPCGTHGVRQAFQPDQNAR